MCPAKVPRHGTRKGERGTRRAVSRFNVRFVDYSETDATATALGVEFFGQSVSEQGGRKTRGRERIRGRIFFSAKIRGIARQACNRSGA